MNPLFDFKTYLRILKMAATVDNRYLHCEKEILYSVAEQYGKANDPEVRKIIEDSSPAFIVEIDQDSLSEVTKRSAIRDAIMIANSDSSISEREKEFIKQLCKKFSLSDSFFDRALKWSEKYLKIISEGRSLFLTEEDSF